MRWLRFLHERHPATHILLVLVFALAQAGVARHLGGRVDAGDLLRLALSCQAFFLLLRLCDEEKDLAEDRLHRPDRPLARGLLSLPELHAGQILSWITFPVLLLSVHWSSNAWVAVTLVWTFLMRREFFLATWLRPRLTRYALSHTLVMVPFAMSCLTFLGVPSAAALPWAFALWFAFNYFEFSRKTFDRTEELPGVDSYTSRFGKVGAVGLSLLQILMTAVCLQRADFDLFRSLPVLGGAVAWSLLAGLWVLKTDWPRAQLLRSTSGLLLSLFLLTGLLQGL
ncbi:MAG: hypothetical protein RL318_2265 [Fibrobacterota bacterium]|jgi:4-hydroxybenzoate polyprenyltransferase